MNSNDDISEVLLPQNQQDGTLISTASSPVQRSRATSADEAPLSGHQDLKVDEAPLTLAFDQLNLHEKPQMAERMFLSLGVIIQHATEELELDIDVQEVQDTLRRADQISGNGNRDVEALATIQAVLAQLFLLRDSNHLVEAATILANASRDALFLRIQATTGVEDRVLIPSLKFIGNTCADTDVNRELAISAVYIPSLVRHVEIPGISRTIVPVIYNISNDNEQAQHAFRTSGLCPALIRLVENPRFQAPDLLTYVYSLLDFSSSDEVGLDPCSDNSVQTVVELLQGDDLEPDDTLLIVHTIGAFLKHDRFQQHFIEHDLVYTLMEVINRSSLAYETEDPDEDVWLSLRKAVTEILSDISATGAFARRYTINSTLVDSLIQWLLSHQQQEQICSCLMLGNLAQSDPVCREMVGRRGLHDSLLEILEDRTHPQVSYAALGFLRNLALPAENKPTVGTQRTVEIIARFWSEDVNPQIQHASVALLRQLLNHCIGNVRWLLESLSPDPDSPAHEKTYLSLLLLLFGRTDDTATKFETGRTVATICRCISSSSQGLPPQSTNAIWHRLYGLHPDIATPLAMMISQSRFPVLRSEGWFALALMARSGEGSAAVSEVFQQLETFGVLVSTITGQSPTSERPATDNTMSSDSNGSDRSPEQVQVMKDKDRENALVLVNELLRHTGDSLSDIRRSVLEDLMRGPQSPERAQELMTRAKSEERLD
ncbi:MAG: hypothetical protein L6R42_009141 [Xanthoria sp. 1 TBL-2021]|nr:MAG: hypothetical protein L6R42_009141 [Xanthoria sp. 1 TBL-2021]